MKKVKNYKHEISHFNTYLNFFFQTAYLLYIFSFALI